MRQIALMTLAVAIGATAACQSSDQKQAEDAAKQAENKAKLVDRARFSARALLRRLRSN